MSKNSFIKELSLISEPEKVPNTNSQNSKSPMLLYPHQSPYLFGSQTNMIMMDSPCFKLTPGFSPAPLLIDKAMMPALSWNLNDSTKQEELSKTDAKLQFDGYLKEESCDELSENSEKVSEEENEKDQKLALFSLSPYNNAKASCQKTFKIKTWMSFMGPLGYKEEGGSILKPKPIHINVQSSFCISKNSTNDEMKDDPKQCSPQQRAEGIEDGITRIWEEARSSDRFEYIKSIYPQGGNIRVLKSHLKRILKLRESKKRWCFDSSDYSTTRYRQDGPMHDSRSKFAKIRPRDQNGRFYTKSELEEMKRQRFRQSIIEYVSRNCIPGLSPDDLLGKSHSELEALFPVKVFKIEHT